MFCHQQDDQVWTSTVVYPPCLDYVPHLKWCYSTIHSFTCFSPSPIFERKRAGGREKKLACSLNSLVAMQSDNTFLCSLLPVHFLAHLSTFRTSTRHPLRACCLSVDLVKKSDPLLLYSSRDPNRLSRSYERHHSELLIRIFSQKN